MSVANGDHGRDCDPASLSDWKVRMRKMEILSKEKLSETLYHYYKERYGEEETDEWYEQPAANVWVFGREGKIITLKSHPLTGEVSEQIE